MSVVAHIFSNPLTIYLQNNIPYTYMYSRRSDIFPYCFVNAEAENQQHSTLKHRTQSHLLFPQNITY
jgi:hypothetical protein